MLYEELQQLPPPAFKRACGVSRQTFSAMVAVLQPQLERQGKRGGQNQLSVADQLLMTLQYWREYRTQFHIGLDFGVSESTVCRTIQKVETLLVRSGQFRLPGRRPLQQNESQWEVVVIDVAEVSIERPQKNRNTITLASKSAIPSKHKLSSTSSAVSF
jgi:Helix-turn-helix of DDE superfamily endonuclease